MDESRIPMKTMAEYVAEQVAEYWKAMMRHAPTFFETPEGQGALASFQNQLIYAYLDNLRRSGDGGRSSDRSQ